MIYYYFISLNWNALLYHLGYILSDPFTAEKILVHRT